MRSSSLIAAVLFVSFLTLSQAQFLSEPIQIVTEVLPQNSSVQPWVPEKYKINLDLSYAEMWQEVVSAKKSEIQAAVSYIFENFLHFSPFKYQFIMNMIGNIFKKYHDQEFVQEIEALANIAEIPFFDAFILNFVYELSGLRPKSLDQVTKSCTSIVAQNKTGNIFHGRNLDFAFEYYIANLTVQGEFYRNGQLVFTGMVIAGSNGILTGMKPNGFALSIDARGHGAGILETLYLMALSKNSWNIQYLSRKVLEEEENYNSAVQRLQQTQLDAGVYYIISGRNYNEGQIISRNPGSIEDVYTLDNDNIWYAVQTNYDRDQADPEEDYRRIPAEQKLNNMGLEESSAENLYDVVMSTFPNNNANTIMTVMMSAQLNYFNVTMWK